MSDRSWEADPTLTRPEHKWVFESAYVQEWGATVKFRCGNPGCHTTLSMGVDPTKDRPNFGGVCFNTARGKRVT